MWYYQFEDQAQGPVSEQDIRTLISHGTISDNTLLWKEGMPEWKPVRDVDEFRRHAFVSPPTSPPPLPAARRGTPAWPVNILLFGCALNVLELITDIVFADFYAGTHFGITTTREEVVVTSVIGLVFATMAMLVAIAMKVRNPSKGGFVFVAVLGGLTLIPGGALTGILLVILSVIGYRKTAATA